MPLGRRSLLRSRLRSREKSIRDSIFPRPTKDRRRRLGRPRRRLEGPVQRVKSRPTPRTQALRTEKEARNAGPGLRRPPLRRPPRRRTARPRAAGKRNQTATRRPEEEGKMPSRQPPQKGNRQAEGTVVRAPLRRRTGRNRQRLARRLERRSRHREGTQVRTETPSMARSRLGRRHLGNREAEGGPARRLLRLANRRAVPRHRGPSPRNRRDAQRRRGRRLDRRAPHPGSLRREREQPAVASSTLESRGERAGRKDQHRRRQRPRAASKRRPGLPHLEHLRDRTRRDAQGPAKPQGPRPDPREAKRREQRERGGLLRRPPRPRDEALGHPATLRLRGPRLRDRRDPGRARRLPRGRRPRRRRGRARAAHQTPRGRHRGLDAQRPAPKDRANGRVRARRRRHRTRQTATRPRNRDAPRRHSPGATRQRHPQAIPKMGAGRIEAGRPARGHRGNDERSVL